MRSGVVVAVIMFVVIACTLPVFAAEPTLEAVLNGFGFTNRTLVSIETFPKGKYNATMYAEWAGWRDTNQLKWYKVGTSTLSLIFDGPDGVPPGQPMGSVSPPFTKSFLSDGTFGLCLITQDGTDYSEKSRNLDGNQHAKIYRDGTDPNLYYIGFENMNPPGSDFDFNDMVLSLKHIQACLTVSSAYDSPTPISGWFDVGTNVMASVSSPVSGSVGTRHVCTGWTGIGDVPASGSNTAVSFIINEDSSITWNWKTQHLLTVNTDPSGLFPSSDLWCDEGTGVALTAESVVGFTFAYWDVDGFSRGDGFNPITVNMNTGHVATSHYVPLYSLAITTTAGGTTDPVPGTYSYTSGSEADVNVTVSSGYLFHHWELDAVDAGSGCPFSVLMGADHTLKAVFSTIPVGGEWVPVSNVKLLTPYIGWASLTFVFTACFVYVRRKKRQ